MSILIQGETDKWFALKTVILKGPFKPFWVRIFPY